MSDRVVHCWTDELDAIEEEHGYLSEQYIAYVSEQYIAYVSERYYDDSVTGRTCMLPDAHAGPHEFVSDDDITIRFTEPAP
jgi:uncharacterized radical SAM superfamily protein